MNLQARSSKEQLYIHPEHWLVMGFTTLVMSSELAALNPKPESMGLERFSADFQTEFRSIETPAVMLKASPSLLCVYIYTDHACMWYTFST